MRVLILGGDGFCGWPTALHLSARGHAVEIVDNGSRRRIDQELGAGSLTPIEDLETRLAAWREVSGRTIRAHRLSVGKDYEALVGVLNAFRPEAVVHFAALVKILLVDQTILADVIRAVRHRPAQRVADLTGHARAIGARAPWPGS